MSFRTLRPRLPPLHSVRRTALSPTTPQALHQTQQRRPFLSSTSPPEKLTANCTLPYSTLGIFNVITSINYYPDFLPFLNHASVRAYSNPDHHYNRKWPSLASLTIGYKGQLTETFTSRVYCVPPIPQKGRAGVGIVEAVAGSASHSLDPDLIGHYTDADAELSDAIDPAAGPLEFLRTRWTVRQFPFKPAAGEPQERTDVGLSLEYRFSNPMYEALGKAASGMVAEMMIQAFEKRVRSVLGRQGTDEKDA